MKILFVGFAASIHVARWIGQLDGQGWELHLFPSDDFPEVHRELKYVTVHHTVYVRNKRTHPSLRETGIRVALGHWRLNAYMEWMLQKLIYRHYRERRVKKLAHLIETLKPDLIHSMEFQHSGYLTMDARKLMGENAKFPPWILSNWGNDIYFFGRLKDHVPKIRELLESCDYYTSECDRDVGLARDFGLRGQVLAVVPNAGGFNLTKLVSLGALEPTSARKRIILKGYQGWAGRSFVALRALEMCADLLQGYTVDVYSASPEVQLRAELFSEATKVPVNIVPYISHDDMLRHFGQARIYIGLSMSDAASTSMLEAMAMGTFPIQSHTACTDEWFCDGETGLMVPPEDPEPVAKAIRRALQDDDMVDRAATENRKVIAERLDYNKIKDQVIRMYEQVGMIGRSVS